jgi:hypothetical protein
VSSESEEIDDERAVELDPWSIRVYQQLQAGDPIDDIKAQFERVVDATPQEVEWILERAKRRYLGYFEEYKVSNRFGTNWMIFGGIGLALATTIWIATNGWSSAGRQNGRAIWAVIVGVGVCGYGIWGWFTAEPKGKRKDIDLL